MWYVVVNSGLFWISKTIFLVSECGTETSKALFLLKLIKGIIKKLEKRTAVFISLHTMASDLFLT